jgi:hypothetical protein
MLPDIREVIASLQGKATSLFSTKDKGVGFQWFGLRQSDFRRKCSCRGIQGTKDNPRCNRCYSTGYLFSDCLVKGYMWLGVLGVGYSAGPGQLSTNQKNLVVQHNRVVNKFDYVLELSQDFDTGEIRQPFEILRQYRIQDCIPIKGDKGRIEFWKCSLEERNILDGRPGMLGNTFDYGGNRSNDAP